MPLIPKAVGYRIVLHMLKKKELQSELKSSVIEIPDEISEKYTQLDGTELAEVVDVGPDCFSSRLDAKTAWCKPGDQVLIVRFAGAAETIDGVRYRIINDEDILAVLDNREERR